MSKARIAAVAPLLLLLMGCQSRRLVQELQDFHVHLLDQQERHLMQNLVRAHLGKPFLQLNLSEVFLDHLDTTNISGRFGETTVDKSVATFFTGAARAIERSVSTPWEISGTAGHAARMSVKLKPVNDSRVYLAYVTYANIKGMLASDDNRNNWGNLKRTEHAWCVYNNTLWYVPPEKKEQFRELFLEVTTKRPSPLGITVKIAKVEEIKEFTFDDETYYRATIRFDKRVPNEDGTLQFILDERKVTLILTPHPDVDINEAATNYFIVHQGLRKDLLDEVPLAGLRGLFISPRTIETSTAPTVQDQLESLQNTFDRVQSIQDLR